MVIFEKIEERDIDLIMMRCFTSLPKFSELFLEMTDWKKATVVSVEHSRIDMELGETDITVVVEYKNKLYALLIENKIDADAMPNQCERYHARGSKGKEQGLYTDYTVFITAPQRYLDINHEAKKYPHHISYEKMLHFFEHEGLGFEQEALKMAIDKKEQGYSVQEVPSITAFWEKLNSYIRDSGRCCEMYYSSGPKGNKSRWVQFRTPLKKTTIYYKSDKGVVDLEFSGRLNESPILKSCINPHKDESMHWEDTGNSLSLRIRVNPVDFQKPFNECIDDVNFMLSAVEKLTSLSIILCDEGVI